MAEGSVNVTTPLGWRQPPFPPEAPQKKYDDVELMLAVAVEAAAKKHITKVLEEAKATND